MPERGPKGKQDHTLVLLTGLRDAAKRCYTSEAGLPALDEPHNAMTYTGDDHESGISGFW